MCKVNCLTVLLFVLFVSAISANADQIIHTQTFSGIPSYQSILTFDKFDPSDGILDSIEIVLDIDITGGKLSLDNDSDSTVSGNAYFGASGELSSSDVTLLKNSDNKVWTQDIFNVFAATLQADDGDDGETSDLDFTGTDMDYAIFDGTAIDGTAVADTINPTSFAGYTGTDTFAILADFTPYIDTSDLGGVQYAVGPPSTSGHVQVTYTYTIPEPTTIILLGMGSLGLLGRKKHIR